MRSLEKLGEGARLAARLGRALGPHVREEKGALAVTLLLSVLVLVLRMAQPWPLKWIVDHLAHGAAKLPWGLPPGAAALTIFCAVYLGVSLLAALVEYGQMLQVGGAVNKVVYAFRRRLFLHVLRLPLAYHEKREVGELVTRVVSDTSRLRRGLAGLALRGARSVLTFLATVAVLFWIDAGLSAVALACGLVAAGRMLLRGRLILKASRDSRKKEGRLASLVEEDLLGIRELQTYRAEGPGDPRFEALNAGSLKSEQKLRRLEAGLLVFVDGILTVALCVIVWLGTTRVTEGRLTTGDLVLFLSYLLNLYRPFAQFARQASKGGRILACGERLVKIVEREPGLSDRPDAVPAPAFSGAVAFQEVGVEIPRDGAEPRLILSNVSFRLEPGQRVAILGPNGAGKSTLLRHAVRLADPSAGRILIDGRDARDYTLATVRAQFSAVYQDAALFGLTVRENIALGRPGATDAEVRAAAARAQVSAFVEALPGQYETVLRRRGKLFSDGEQQRVALSRAILRDGRIWLLDEPTTGLDAVAAERLEEALLEATRGRTTLWVTHHLPTAAKLDRVLFLEEGAAKFFGPPDEFARWARAASPRETFLRDLSERL